MTRAKIQSFLFTAILAPTLFAPAAARAGAQNRARVATSPATAQAPAASAPSPVEPGSSAPAAEPTPTLADFAWLEGRWQGTWGQRLAEQCWTAPRAGMMLGTFRLVEDEKTLVIELFTLVERPDAIHFYFRHFTPALLPWEKTNATFLNLVSLDSTKATFENPIDGEPKHAILTRVDADTYVSRSEIVPETGDLQVIEITYHRQKQVTAATQPSGGSGARP